MNVPNLITSLRICMIPVIVVVLYLPFDWTHITGALIFMFVAFTDWIDGYLARKLNQTTSLGAFLDPVADKLIVVITLAVLIEKHHNPLLTIPSLIIIGREITILAFRERMAEIGKQASVAVNIIGKFKTILQMAAITLLIWAKDPSNSSAETGWIIWVSILGFTLLYAAVALTIWSLIVYVRTSLEP